MAFFFEKVSKKDAQKFYLDDLWNYYHVGAYIYLPDRDFNYDWNKIICCRKA